MLKGGCLCGNVRYGSAADLLYPPTLCHCRSCQRAAGAHAVAWLTVPLASLHYDAASPTSFSSSPGVRRGFCGRCGTPLTYWNERRAQEIDVAVCTLDDPSAIAPLDNIWTEDAVHWEPSLSVLPRLARSRTAD